jgi:hypothetical protein
MEQIFYGADWETEEAVLVKIIGSSCLTTKTPPITYARQAQHRKVDFS